MVDNSIILAFIGTGFFLLLIALSIPGGDPHTESCVKRIWIGIGIGIVVLIGFLIGTFVYVLSGIVGLIVFIIGIIVFIGIVKYS